MSSLGTETVEIVTDWQKTFERVSDLANFCLMWSVAHTSSPIVTANLPFENWSEVFGSERLTGATLDRLAHRMHFIEANSESCRLR